MLVVVMPCKWIDGYTNSGGYHDDIDSGFPHYGWKSPSPCH